MRRAKAVVLLATVATVAATSALTGCTSQSSSTTCGVNDGAIAPYDGVLPAFGSDVWYAPTPYDSVDGPNGQDFGEFVDTSDPGWDTTDTSTPNDPSSGVDYSGSDVPEAPTADPPPPPPDPPADPGDGWDTPDSLRIRTVTSGVARNGSCFSCQLVCTNGSQAFTTIGSSNVSIGSACRHAETKMIQASGVTSCTSLPADSNTGAAIDTHTPAAPTVGR